ncbi:ribosome maturation factor RimM [Myxococcota bacterium]|nr:ribosome maturation factor RimM [Myxococcota bacterium]
MNSDSRIVLAEILGAHGLRGELRVRVAGDSAENLLAADSLWLGRGLDDAAARRVVVLGVGAGRSGELRLRLEGVDDRDQAEALKRLVVMTERSALSPLPSGEYYWHELVGCRVESESGLAAGVVQEIWETGAHDVLLVVDEQGVRRLVPTAAALMKSVDLEARRIVVADLPGLLDPV